MIQDNDEQVIERHDRYIKTLKCIELFVENYKQDNLKSLRREGYPGMYDKDKVRDFYNSKDAKFRKMIKSANMTVSIHNDFHHGDGYDDIKGYVFYFKGKFLFGLNLHFTNKNIRRSTYDDLQYRVVDTADVTSEDLYQIVANHKAKYV